MTGQSPTAEFLSSYRWTKDREDFGGYSGLILSPDGGRFTILSDRSHLIEGSILRHGDRILGVRSQRTAPLGYPAALFDEKTQRDTEGLAQDSNGRLYVSLESDNRIIRRDPDGTWAVLPAYPSITKLPLNKGLEALAIAPDGSIYTIPEASAGMTVPFSVFRYSEDKGWSVPYVINRTRGHVPVGADFGPDGLLYVLERGFAGFGFFSQVRRFHLGTETVLDGETLFKTKARRHDNLEGLAVWQAKNGELRLTMISDDNFNRFQKTEIVDYAVRN